MIIAALLALPVIPLWAFSTSPALLAIGAFLMQFTGRVGRRARASERAVAGHARRTFPGFVYQLGNLLVSVNATLQAGIASHFGGNYGLALAVVAGSVAIIIAVYLRSDGGCVMAKNIVIFSDGTGQAGGINFDEARTNVYKFYRACRVGPDSPVDPAKQVAFYDPGLGSAAYVAG